MIDSEWKENYLSVRELKRLLTYSEILNPKLKTIVTVSLRHFGSMKRIKNLTELAGKHENLGLNLVAGNRVYLTTREQERPAVLLLTRALKLATKRLEGSRIFVGAEGLVNTVSRLVSEYEITPFLLLDRSLEADVSKIRSANNECSIAVYAPYLMFAAGRDASDEVISRLLDYALRRGWVQETLKEGGYDLSRVRALLRRRRRDAGCTLYQELRGTLIGIVRELSIFGDEQAIGQALQTLKEASIIVGFPIKEEKRQVKDFARIVQNLDFS